MKIKEVFSDLFKLRNAVNIKKEPPPKKWTFLGVGGPQMTLWKGNIKGVGVKTKEPSVGGGYGYFLEPHDIWIRVERALLLFKN